MNSLTDAAQALREAYAKWHHDGVLVFGDLNLQSFREKYAVSFKQAPGGATRESIGGSYEQRQQLYAQWIVWTSAALGDAKHFKLYDHIVSFIFSKGIQGLSIYDDLSVLESFQLSQDGNWRFTLLRQIYSFDIQRNLEIST